MTYLLHILVIAGIFMILSISLNLLLGYAGVLSLAHAAFYGVGAYTAAILAGSSVLPPELSLPAAFVLTALLGAVLALPAIRLRGDALILATLAFHIAVLGLIHNWTSVTKGPWGISGIQPIQLLGWECQGKVEYLILVSVICVAAAAFTWRLVNSPYGRLLKAIREDEVLSLSLGKDTALVKIGVFAVTAGFAGLAGALYAHYVTYIDPSSFTIMESVLMITIVIVGGTGSFWGPIIGSILLVSLPEFLRFVEMPVNIAANVRQVLYGVLLIGCMIWRPQGIIGEYSLGRHGLGPGDELGSDEDDLPAEETV